MLEKIACLLKKTKEPEKESNNFVIKTYTPEQQQEVIEEKVKLLRPLIDWSVNPLKIRDKIYWKRIKWFEENYLRVSEKLKKYPTPVGKASDLVFFEYMGIDPKDIDFTFFPNREDAEAVFIRSKNFCPYLEVFKRFNLRPDYYCHMVLEEPVTDFANAFLAKEGFKFGVWFGRNYYDRNLELGLGETGAGIRPCADECQEYFIDRSLQFSDRGRFKAYLEMFKANLKIDYKDARELVGSVYYFD
jgi:hypothetical protein